VLASRTAGQSWWPAVAGKKAATTTAAKRHAVPDLSTAAVSATKNEQHSSDFNRHQQRPPPPQSLLATLQVQGSFAHPTMCLLPSHHAHGHFLNTLSASHLIMQIHWQQCICCSGSRHQARLLTAALSQCIWSKWWQVLKIKAKLTCPAR